MIDIHLGDGFFPSVTWDGAWVWCAWQDGGMLVAAKFDAALQPVTELRFPLGPEALAFPVLTRTPYGEVFVVYRDGAPDYAIRLRSLTRGLIETLVLNGGGNKPCAIDTDYVAWQDAGFTVWRRGLLGDVALSMRPGAPTGLSRLRSDGWPVLWDEDYTSVPGMTAPAFTGPVTVGEHPSGGVTGSWAGLSWALWLWPGADTKAPSAAYSASLDRCLVTAWGATGIRLGMVGPDDVRELPHPAPAPGPIPPHPPGPTPPNPPPQPIPPRPPAQPSPQPEPPEGTAPMPAPIIVTFRSVHGRYLCAEEGGGAIITGDRLEASAWERFTLTEIGEGYITLQSADGHYVCAEEGGGRELTATRDAYGAWEALRLIPLQEGHVIQVSDGRYVCAEPDGRVVADRTEIGAYETWTVTGLPVPPEPPGPTPTPTPPSSALVGRLRVSGGAFCDDTGPRLPVGCHLGDGLSAWVRDSKRVIRDALDPIAAAGYQWVRVWWQLADTGYWAGRGVGPLFTPDFTTQVQAFHAACRARGLQIHWASGDFTGYSTARARRSVELMAQTVADDERAYGDVCCLWEGVNEAGGTTDGWGPSEIGALVQHAQTMLDPSMLVTWSAYGGTEEKDVLTAWTPPANPFFYYHGYRGGFYADKFRHPFSNVYEAPVRRLGWSGEPFGLGSLVSTWENQGEMDDPEAMACFGAAHLLFRQAFCYMSSDGVKIQGSIDRWNGFREIPALARYLETFAADLHRLPILTHVGDYKPDRAWDLPDNDAGVRLDQAVGDRIAVGLLYGPAGSVLVQALGSHDTVVLNPATLSESTQGRSFSVSYRFGRILLARW